MAADPLTSRTVDDLLLDDAGFDTDDDPFADKPPRNAERDDKTTLSPRKRKAVDSNPFGDNLDEEVKISKQRKKIPKLDAERLLSEPGLPKIRTLLRTGQFKRKLRFKGKGHEFSDAARLLNYYQMWLDQLYPRAKFADAIQLVEKAGHTKKMQMYRKSWIDEGRPGYVRKEDVDRALDMQDVAPSNEQSEVVGKDHNGATIQSVEEDPALMFFESHNIDNDADDAGPDNDELDALMAQDERLPAAIKQSHSVDIESEGEDDLDAVLAMHGSRSVARSKAPYNRDQGDSNALLATDTTSASKQNTPKAPEQPVEEDEDDELDALLNEDSQPELHGQVSLITKQNNSDDFSEDGMDDLDILLNNQEAPEPELPSISAATPSRTASKTVPSGLPGSEEVPELDDVISSSPIPNVGTDELDKLMDEHDATLKQKDADAGVLQEFMSSSPIPNRDSQ